MAAAAGLLAGLIQTLPSFLVPLHRNFYERKFPAAKAAWANDGPFTHFAVIGGEGEDTLNYMTRGVLAAREWIPGDPFLPEGDRSAQILTRGTLSFVFLGAMNRLTGSPDAALIGTRVAMTAVLFFCLFWFAGRFGCAPRQALFCAAFATLTFDVTFGAFFAAEPLNWIKGLIRRGPWLLGGDFTFFGINRIIRPAFNYPAMLAASALTIAALESKGKAALGGAAGAGLAGGLLAYVHADVWMVYVVAAAIVWGERFYRNKRPEAATTVLCAVAAAVSLPFFLINTTTDPDDLINIPMMTRRVFYWPSLLYLGAGWWFYLRADDRMPYRWAAAVMAAAFVHQNLSLVAGIGFDADYIALIANLVLAASLFPALIARLQDHERWLWAAAIVAVFGVARMVSYSAQTFKTYGLPSDYANALAWIGEHLPSGTSAATLDGEVALLLPLHAGARPLAHRFNILTSGMSVKETLRRTRESIDCFVAGADLEPAIARFSNPGGQGIREEQAWTGTIDRAAYHAHPAATLYPPGLVPLGLIGREGGVDYRAKIEAGLRANPSKACSAALLWEGPLERSLRTEGGKPAAAGQLLYENARVRLWGVKG